MLLQIMVEHHRELDQSDDHMLLRLLDIHFDQLLELFFLGYLQVLLNKYVKTLDLNAEIFKRYQIKKKIVPVVSKTFSSGIVEYTQLYV